MEEKKILLKALGTMYLSRVFENKTETLINSGKIHGTTHLAVGQEACQVGLISALDNDDYIISTHRCHGYTIAKGSEPEKMFAELAGYKNGLCKGLGGSMHFTDMSKHNAGSSAIVASAIPIATGIAYGLKKSGNKNNISISIFGDGACNRGTLHESLNMASIWNLPVLYYLENNLYGMSEATKDMTATTSIASRCEGYNIKHSTVDGNDFLAVFKEVKKARDYILSEGRPYFIELLTYRQKGHSKNDNCLYRSKEEEAAWLKRDPIALLEKYLIENGVSEKELETLKADKFNEINVAADKTFNQTGQFLTQAEANNYVFSESPSETLQYGREGNTTFREAIRLAIADEMIQNKKTVLFGEDIGFYGGCFHVTRGLCNIFPDQLQETPVSEESFTGLALGSTIVGYRPIVEVMYADFFTLISDQIINHASQSYFMTGGQINSPIVIRLPEGSGTGHGPQHTQSPEAAFANTPGLIMVSPSTVNDAYYLLREAIKNNNPVLFFEHKLLYTESGKIDFDSKPLLGKAAIRTEGNACTIISYSHASLTCYKAVLALKAKGIDCTLVDLRTICPLDKETILSCVRKTGKVLIVQDAPLSTSISSEVMAIISEDEPSFKALKKPIIRLGGQATPVPFTEVLENNYIPSVQEVENSVLKLLK